MINPIDKKRMRVLQLGKFYPVRGGVEKVMYDLLTGFSERADCNVHCDMICASGEGVAGSTLFINGIARLICCRTLKKIAATMIAPSMITVLRKECGKYDIIHVHHPDPMAALALCLSGYKGKVIVHWHSDVLKQKILLRFYHPLQEWLLRRADLVIGTTPVYLSQSPCLKRVQHKTVSLPIGVEPVCPLPQAVGAVRSRYPGKKIVFSLGRLVAYKGFKYLVNAATYLSDDYVILIGGTGALEQELRTEIETLGLKQKVFLLGRVSDADLPAYYGACDLFCLSSIQKTEAFGIVQIEAMSCGKPVVATNIPQSGVAWVNAHGVSGLNVETCNPRQLAEAIMTITSDEDVYRGYAMRAEQRYKDMFTKDQMMKKCIEIYYDLLWKEQNLN